METLASRAEASLEGADGSRDDDSSLVLAACEGGGLSKVEVYVGLDLRLPACLGRVLALAASHRSTPFPGDRAGDGRDGADPFRRAPSGRGAFVRAHAGTVTARVADGRKGYLRIVGKIPTGWPNGRHDEAAFTGRTELLPPGSRRRAIRAEQQEGRRRRVPFPPLVRNPANPSNVAIVEVLDGGRIRRPPCDEQPDDRGSGKAGGQDRFRRPEMRPGRQDVVDDGDEVADRPRQRFVDPVERPIPSGVGRTWLP